MRFYHVHAHLFYEHVGCGPKIYTYIMIALIDYCRVFIINIVYILAIFNDLFTVRHVYIVIFVLWYRCYAFEMLLLKGFHWCAWCWGCDCLSFYLCLGKCGRLPVALLRLSLLCFWYGCVFGCCKYSMCICIWFCSCSYYVYMCSCWPAHYHHY